MPVNRACEKLKKACANVGLIKGDAKTNKGLIKNYLEVTPEWRLCAGRDCDSRGHSCLQSQEALAHGSLPAQLADRF